MCSSDLSPVLTGTPTAPTPALDSDTQQIITAAYLLGMLSGVAPTMDGVAAVGTSTRLARADHRHPTDTSRAPLDSPALTGTPTAPTPDAGDNSTRLATTAWVLVQAFVRGNRTVFAGTGLTGGGDLSANRTIAADFATQAEAETRTAADKVMSPLRVAQEIASLFATQAEAEAGSSNSALMTPQRTAQALAAQLATQGEAEAQASNSRLMTPLRTGQAITSLLATEADAAAGTSNNKLMTPLRTAQAVTPLVNQQIQGRLVGIAAALSTIFG